jgi:hypothetical protein
MAIGTLTYGMDGTAGIDISRIPGWVDPLQPFFVTHARLTRQLVRVFDVSIGYEVVVAKYLVRGRFVTPQLGIRPATWAFPLAEVSPRARR